MSKRQREDDLNNPVNPTTENSNIKCPSCTDVYFSTYVAYEAHVLSIHTHVCNQCHRSFPTETILDIHVDEVHSSYFAAKKDRGDKVYRCFEPSCTKRSSNHTKRTLHMIDKHHYPRNYRFNVVHRGLTDSISLLE
ncbi:hypothetical protein CAAN1_01S06898 [[Candida] anglica]